MDVTATLWRDDEGHVPKVMYIVEQVNHCPAPQRYDITCGGRCGHFRVCTLRELCEGLSGFLREFNIASKVERIRAAASYLPLCEINERGANEHIQRKGHGKVADKMHVRLCTT